jgi:hypothetical protein
MMEAAQPGVSEQARLEMEMKVDKMSDFLHGRRRQSRRQDAKCPASSDLRPPTSVFNIFWTRPLRDEDA